MLYFHRQNNQLPALPKNIPENVNKRLSCISSTQQVFNEAIPSYQKALNKSGYYNKLTYDPLNKRTKRQNRKSLIYRIATELNAYHQFLLGITLQDRKRNTCNGGQKSLELLGKNFLSHPIYFSKIQMWHNMHFSNHVDTANGPRLPPPNNVGMKKLNSSRTG